MNNPLITEQGKERLQQELNHLWLQKRPIITQAVSEAAALGDRSENAEYKEGKRLLREIDRRIYYLRKRLDILKIVHYSEEQEGKVYFGAWLKLENEQGEALYCRIVGIDEIDSKNKHISIESPMAKAMIGRQEGDTVVVETPAGHKIWSIDTIQYKPFENNDI